MRKSNLNHLRVSLWAVAISLVAGGALADDEPLLEKLDHGQIDWSARTVLVTGSGAPNLKLENVAKVRLAAERSAQLDAYRKVLEALKGVRITAGVSGGKALGKVQVRAQVQGMVRGCKTIDTRYYSDGAVDIVLQCPLDKGIATAIAPSKPKKQVSKKGDATHSGLIVDATGFGLKPALAPRVVDGEGRELYGMEMVGPGHLRDRGVAGFARTLDAALDNPRVGKEPLVVRAIGLGAGATEIQVSEADAKKLSSGNVAFLAEGRVVIATDAL